MVRQGEERPLPRTDVLQQKPILPARGRQNMLQLLVCCAQHGAQLQEARVRALPGAEGAAGPLNPKP